MHPLFFQAAFVAWSLFMQYLSSSGVNVAFTSIHSILSAPASFYSLLAAPLNAPSPSNQVFGSGSPTRPLGFVFPVVGKHHSWILSAHLMLACLVVVAISGVIVTMMGIARSGSDNEMRHSHFITPTVSQSWSLDDLIPDLAKAHQYVRGFTFNKLYDVCVNSTANGRQLEPATDSWVVEETMFSIASEEPTSVSLAQNDDVDCVGNEAQSTMAPENGLKFKTRTCSSLSRISHTIRKPSKDMPSYAKLLPAHPGRDHSIATIASNSFESIQAKSIKSSTYSHLSDAELDLLAEGMQQRVQALRNRSRRRKTTLVMSREPEDESVHARNLQSKTLRHTERKPSEPIVEDEDAWDEELEQLRFDLRMTKMEGRQSELAISRKEKSTAQLSSLESEETLVDYAALDAEVLGTTK